MPTVECSTACTVTIVHELAIPPFTLTLAEAGALAGAILLIWGVAWGIRMAIQALSVDERPPESSD